MLITALRQIEKPGHREGNIHLWDWPAAQIPGRSRVLPPTWPLWNRDLYPVSLQMASCTLSSPFHRRRRLSRGTLMLGCQHVPLQLGWNAGPSQGHAWLPSLCCWRGRQPFFESVHPPAKYSISADSIFSVHFKCTFQQKPCRISATDPTAGCPGGFCPFPVRKDVLGMESSCGAHPWPGVPHAHRPTAAEQAV